MDDGYEFRYAGLGEMATLSLGKYRLIAELGHGGMADVFLAVTGDSSQFFTKLVVIKKLREHLTSDVEFLTMLIDEARIAARLNHPNLVQTLEVGESNGERFLTMEYLDGQPLHRILSRARSTFTRGMMLTVLSEVLSGIHYAHELTDFDGSPLRIVHRDVTPHNIFVTYEGQVKVVDFGIAKAAGRAGETRHGVIKGKAPYMAPEQACGMEVDRRVDIFAIGVVAFEAATQQRMWKGVKEIDIVRNLVSGRIPASPKERDTTVDDELDLICRRALTASPDGRYPTAAAMQRDIDAYLSARNSRATRAELGAFVSETFADKRAETARIIGSQLARMRAEADSVALVAMPMSSAGGSSAEIANPTSRPVQTRNNSTSSESNSSESNSSESNSSEYDVELSVVEDDAQTSVMGGRRFRWVLVAAIVLAAALAATIGIVLLLHPDGRRTDDANAGPANPVGTSKKVTVTLRATPLETKFSIDNGPAVDNPYIGVHARDGKEHTIRAVAPGYPPKTETVTFSEDVSIRFSLAPTRAQH